MNALTQSDMEKLAKDRAKERARDARLLAAYQRECRASWEGVTYPASA
jgi:hypothetical protein